ncbi:MAG TPA: multicopper oxidase domain-containing protein [Candidatus Paceibacterota bacterium]
MENQENTKKSDGINKLWIFLLIIVLIIAAGTLFSIAKPNKSPYRPELASDVKDISANATDVFPTADARDNKAVLIKLKATQVVSELAPGVSYEYWTYNSQVPGPFIRVKEGDTVEIELTHEHAHNVDSHAQADSEPTFLVNFIPTVFADTEGDNVDGHMMANDTAEHMAAGHGEHSIDLHAVIGPGGGAEATRVGPNQTKTFKFIATRPGIYVYHCASPHVPTHIANGMYGLILVEPKAGLPPVDKEYYVVQGEFYTKGRVGDKGHQEFDKDKLLNEKPEYIVFNGRKGSLSGDRALHAKVGDRIRIFFGVSGQLASNFHVIGEIFDKVYPEGDLVSPPHKNIQTTLVPAGGATMVEFTAEVPGKYLLVDHALTRAVDRGALGELIVE